MSDEKLITVKKDGVVIEVHPTTLAAHKAAGWVECEAVGDANDNASGLTAKHKGAGKWEVFNAEGEVVAARLTKDEAKAMVEAE